VSIAMAISSGEEQSGRIEALLEKLTDEIDDLKQQTERTNDRVETYQKASQQVVNLAFGLILTSSLAIIIPAILGR
jgi:prefoldin subunit 5